MRPAVRRAFHKFSEPLEGRVPWMYLDRIGKVTTAIGILLPLSLALQLPWRETDGSLATRASVTAAWNKVNAAKHLAPLGGAHRAFRDLTSLRLSPGDLDAIVERKLAQVDLQLVRRWPGYAAWPADGQLGVISWAWAAGAAAEYPRMSRALDRQQFRIASVESDTKTRIEEKLPNGKIQVVYKPIGTQILRNARQRVLLRNAAVVLDDGLDPDELYFPTDLEAPDGPAAA